MKARWVFWVLVISFVWVVVSQFTEIQKLIETLVRAHWQWVMVAAVLQLAYYIIYTGLYQSAFDIVDVKSRVRELLPITFASIFLNVAAPSGGTSGMALFVDDARRRGESATRAAVGTLLVLIADFGGFLLILIVGIALLFTRHALKTYEVMSALILFASVGGMAVLLLFGLWSPGGLRKILEYFEHLVNRLAARFGRQPIIATGWAERNSTEFIEAAVAVAAHPEKVMRTFLISLCGYIVDISSLYSVFQAFHQPVAFEVLVSGFSMGILFWIVSVTPQGIGIVEGMMTLVFTSLGVPAERAAVVAIAFRGLTFWFPMLAGFLLLRRLKSFRGESAPYSDVSSIRLVSLLVAAMGVINIASAVTPSLRNRLVLLEKYSPFGVSTGGHLTIALAGFALLILANGLWRRKRTAWLLSVAVLVISIPTHLIKGFDYEEAIIAAGLAGLLIELRHHFHARSDVPSLRQGLFAVASALLFTLIYGITGFYLLDRHFKINFGFWAAARQTVIMFSEFYSPGLEPVTGFGRYFADSIYLVGALTGLYGLTMLVRPVLLRTRGTPHEQDRARTIVEAHGHTSLARLTLLEDKSYYFSPRNSLLSYVVKGRVALTLGDPIGPKDDAEVAISVFKDFAGKNDWLPAFYQVLPDYLDLYRRAGFNSLCLGHEGIVDLVSFTLAGGANKNFRTSVNRMLKEGHKAELMEPPHSPELLLELNEISNEWLTSRRSSEKRFSLGWFDERYLNDCRIMLIRNSQGWVDAFANIVSEFQAKEVTLDLMRHRRSAAHGQMDFLFASLFEWAKGAGYQTFNLGLSALSGVGETSEDPAIERALHYIYEHVNQFYNFKGLHEYKEKFHPNWSPRYLIYPGVISLASVTIAILQADSGDRLLSDFFK